MIESVIKKWILKLGLIIIGLGSFAQADSGEFEKLKEELSDLQERIATLEQNKLNEDDPNEFKVFWKEGLHLTTEDGTFKLKIGGRLMNDWLWSSEDKNIKTSIGEQEDGVEFRRARLYFSGSIYDNIVYKFQLDFAGGDTDIKDAFLALTDIPIGKIKIGHFKEPFSLEELTSSNFNTFLERALPNAFVPGRNTGIMLHSICYNDRLTAAIGIFRDTNDFGENSGDDGGYNITGRITALPIYENEGRELLHLGIAYSNRNPDDSYSYDSAPEAHLAKDFVDTGSIAGDRIELLGLEAAWVKGPFSLQSEYITAKANRFIGSDLRFDGYYVQASYFLTGEHRNYKTCMAAFDRIAPIKNFKYGGGPGAWEAKLRFSELDLNDSTITGGKLNNITAGLNWYLNPNTRIMWDFVHADKDKAGQADMLMMRLQFDF